MSDFSAQNLVDAAAARFGLKVLREKIQGAESDWEKADIQLRQIGAGVISRVQASVGASVGWPLPGTWPDGSVDANGTDISGKSYSEVWPPLLLELALWIFRKWTVAGLAEIPKGIETLGTLAENYLDQVQAGSAAVNVGGSTDVTVPSPTSARDREGRALVGGITDRASTINAFSGGGWDWAV
jgi:hypothetical protein